MTSAALAICGIALGLTNEAASMRVRPVAERRFRRLDLLLEEMGLFSFPEAVTRANFSDVTGKPVHGTPSLIGARRGAGLADAAALRAVELLDDTVVGPRSRAPSSSPRAPPASGVCTWSPSLTDTQYEAAWVRPALSPDGRMGALFLAVESSQVVGLAALGDFDRTAGPRHARGSGSSAGLDKEFVSARREPSGVLFAVHTHGPVRANSPSRERVHRGSKPELEVARASQTPWAGREPWVAVRTQAQHHRAERGEDRFFRDAAGQGLRCELPLAEFGRGLTRLERGWDTIACSSGMFVLTPPRRYRPSAARTSRRPSPCPVPTSAIRQIV
jgi:hypothetical protein